MSHATFSSVVMGAYYASMYMYNAHIPQPRPYSDPSIPAHTYTEWAPPRHAYDERELEILEALFPEAFEQDAPDLVCSPSGLEYEWSDEFNDYVPVPASAPAPAPTPAPFALKPSTEAFVPGHLRQLPAKSPVFGGLGLLHVMGRLERFKLGLSEQCLPKPYEDTKSLEEHECEASAPPPSPAPRVLPLWSIHIAEIWGQVIDDTLPPPDLSDAPLFETCLPLLPPIVTPQCIRSASAAAVATSPATSETPHAHFWKHPTFEDMLPDGRPAASHCEMSSRLATESDAVLVHPRPQRWDSAESSRSSSSPGFWSAGATDRASSASSAPSDVQPYKMSPGPRFLTLG